MHAGEVTQQPVRGILRRPVTWAAGLVLIVGVSAGVVVLQDQDRGCSGAAYTDFKAHLASRGATATCDDFKATVSAGMTAGAETEGQAYYESLPEAGFEPDQASSSAIEYVRVPNMVGLDPNTAYDVAEDTGLRLSNGRVGSWGVVSTQTPAAGSRAKVGSGIFISINSGS